MNRPALLQLDGITLQESGRVILDHISLSVHPGEIVTVIGPNGAGKSSLLRIALGLLSADSGQVHRSAKLRIGYMPQHFRPSSTLPMSVGDFLQLVDPRPHAGQLPPLLALVGLEADILPQSLHSLSGGETQRLLLARALLRQPELLVLDEPTQGVDVGGQEEFYRLLGDIRRKRHCGILMVSHDLHLVMAETDTVVCLNGHVCCSGRPEAVTAHPAYLALFGQQRRPGLVLYTHHHDHTHDHAHDQGHDQGHAPHGHGPGCQHPASPVAIATEPVPTEEAHSAVEKGARHV